MSANIDDDYYAFDGVSMVRHRFPSDVKACGGKNARRVGERVCRHLLINARQGTPFPQVIILQKVYGSSLPPSTLPRFHFTPLCALRHAARKRKIDDMMSMI